MVEVGLGVMTKMLDANIVISLYSRCDYWRSVHQARGVGRIEPQGAEIELIKQRLREAERIATEGKS
jgi:hypothetical protein